MGNVQFNKLFFGSFILFSIIVICLFACQSNYSSVTQDYFARILGKEFENYEYYSSLRNKPTIGHIYFANISAGPEEPVPGNRAETRASNWLPDDVSDEESKFFFKKVFDSAYGPTVSSIENIQKESGFNFTSPVSSAITELGLSLAEIEKINIEVHATKFIYKEILWSELHDRKDQLRLIVRRLINEELGDIVVINKVVMVEGYKSKVSIDSSINPSITAKLNSLIKEEKFGLNWKKDAEGTYTAIASEPMVVAVQFAVPSPDPTRSSGQKLVPIRLSEQQFQDFLTNNSVQP